MPGAVPNTIIEILLTKPCVTDKDNTEHIIFSVDRTMNKVMNIICW